MYFGRWWLAVDKTIRHGQRRTPFVLAWEVPLVAGAAPTVPLVSPMVDVYVCRVLDIGVELLRSNSREGERIERQGKIQVGNWKCFPMSLEY